MNIFRRIFGKPLTQPTDCDDMPLDDSQAAKARYVASYVENRTKRAWFPFSDPTVDPEPEMASASEPHQFRQEAEEAWARKLAWERRYGPERPEIRRTGR